MNVIAAIVAGALTGAVLARKRKGNAADMAHYAASYAILFGVLGLVASIVIARIV